MRDQPDRIDTRILKLLQKNARTTNVEIARLLGMAPSSIMERVRKLEKSGMILGYSARINPRMAGAGLLAFVFCKADKWPPSRTAAIRLAKHAWVQEIHDLSGEDCFVVKLRCKDTDELGAILREHFGSNDLIKSTRTTIVLDTVKESSEVPLT